jgi:hypothetical protein
VTPASSSRQAVTEIELEYVQKFLIPATSYDLLPRCPRQPPEACSDLTTIAKLRAAQLKLHDMIVALRDFADASPDVDATALIVSARASLTTAETILPATGAAP